MKQLRIEKLSISNFKGMSEFNMIPRGQSISVYGDNGTGKTTIADAMSHLLFGKDFAGKTDFQIKPVDRDGNEIHNLNTEIKAIISINNDKVELKKVFSEKWVTPRGAIKAEFSGHNTEYFIDSVLTKKKDYDEFIKGVINDSLFKILTNPLEFNNLHWQKRRETLVGICGKIKDSDIIESDRELSVIPAILNGLSLEKKEAQNLSRKKTLIKEIDQIPARIDELTSSLPEVQPDLEKKKILVDTLSSKKTEINSIMSNTKISELQIKINEINAKILAVKNSLPDISALKKPALAEIDKLESERRNLSSKISDIESQIKTEEKRLAISREARESLVSAWHEENKKKFRTDLTCQTCGQIIPEDQIKESEARFNLEKAKKLAAIQTEGKAQKKRIEERESSLAQDMQKVADLNAALLAVGLKIGSKTTELNSIMLTPDPEATTLIVGLETTKAETQHQIQSLRNGSKEKEDMLKAEILIIEEDLDIIATQEAGLRAAEATKSRIKELNEKEKALAAEFEALEHELFLIKQFTTKKIQLLEEKINSKFRLASFKMFKTLVNGDIEDCCETLFNGVPYNSGLNNASRINTGLDIINTLSDHYQFSAPIFIDNAESVTELIPTKAQVIRLVVDANYTTLTSKIITEPKAA